ncbi:hypothetical protein CJD36_020065 [Flavipsychrobacter stenotrophus]|uniref:Ig-like domain-containing protein n=1 Tax=Flavipsychrobacter stenotrophus TaxID=2077091 RepID=A0A2S7SSM6_9BACT|nr:T9SS type A sorting domain-containing protein [Flavipsychrobacter stenotrophus]PQJ09536.1 hypothetical protein CJD36_020065 [Flavipsychrobacter stenotrophus]
MKKLLALVFTLILFCSVTQGQTAASYAFFATSGSFASISGTGTAATGTYNDDITQTTIPIGFSFTFCGTSYNQLSVCSNGFLSLANSTSTANTNSAANVAGAGFLMPYWDDLYGNNSTAYYQTTGAFPNRVFTFEYKNWTLYNLLLALFFGVGSGNENMQVKLYESTNVIEFWYGSSTFGTANTPSATIGIANSTTDFQTLPNVSASPVPSSATFTTSLNSSPATNQIYRWSPGCTITASAANNGPICSGNTLSLTGTIFTGTATTFSWAGPAGYSSNLQSPSITNAPTTRGGTYTFTATSSGGCSYSVTTTAVVDSTPTATISGTTSFCSGGSSTITFTGTAAATVYYTINGGPIQNILLNAAGTATVSTGTLTTGASATSYTYALTSATKGSCSRTITGSAVVTVNPLPAAITGPLAVCEGGFITTLTSSPTTGSWSSTPTTIASVNPTTGIVTSGLAGNAVVTYALPVTGCSVTATVTVNPTPPPITGSLQVCQSGGTTTLSDPIPAGTWMISPASLASISSSGVVTGILPGTATVTYTVGTTCYTTASVVVNPSLSPITGPGAVCVNSSITLGNPVASGTWSASPATVATIDPVTGQLFGVGPGIVNVTYVALTSCQVSRNITVNPPPAAITGTPDVCLGYTTSLANTSAPGSWSSANPAIASVNSSTGLVTGAGAGTTQILYTLSTTGCSTSITSTVNPIPAPITGITPVCGGGATITLANTTPLGDWTSGNTTIATADAATGMITGVSAGTAPVTYTITSTGCYVTANVPVLPIPTPISGLAGVCEAGSTITLTDATPGTWSISPAGTASISTSGMVTGISAGAAVVTYTGGNNCFVTHNVTVNPLPATLTGVFTVCQMAATTLSSTSTGGGWSSLNPFIATVGASGDVWGVLGGNATIVYTLPTGCKTNAIVTVNTIPAPIGGNNYVCHGYTSVLTNSVSGGTWSISPLTTATIDATGTIYGVTIGSATATYTTGSNGCFITRPITVNPIVPAGLTLSVSPSNTVCAGTTVTFTPNPVNGGSSPIFVWSVNGVILSGASTYSYTPANGDIIRLWYISSYDCAMPDTASDVITMTVHPIVTPGISIATGMGDTVCALTPITVTATPVAGGAAPVYQWYVNLSPVGAGPTYNYTPTNGDVVTCMLTSNAFCRTATTASATKVLTVSPKLNPLVSMTSSLGYTTCEGYPSVFTASQINGGFNPTYQWAVNGTNTGTGPVYTYAPVNGDDVSVTLTSSFPCLLTPTANTHSAMTVLPITQPVGVVTAVPGYIIPAGMYDTFTCTILSGGGLAPTYQWSKNSVPVVGATNNVYITNALINGDSVNCEVTNTDQCSGVSVFNSVIIAIGSNVGVNEVSGTGNNFKMIPNPNNGTFIIKGTIADQYNEDLQMEITDMLGRTIHSSTTRSLNGEINQDIQLDNTLTNGMYLLTLRSKHVNNVIHFVINK